MTRPLALLTTLLLTATPLCAQSPDWDAGENPTAHLERAAFRWWAPPDARTIRGVFVLIPGRNGDGRNAVTDPEWQALATRHGLALVGCSLFKTDPTYQSDPDGSTAKMLDKAIGELAKANGHPEAANAPVLFWGHSAGSNTAERFAAKFPRRTLAIVSIKGTWGPGEATPAKCDVPILCCIGQKDKPEWVESARKYYDQGKAGRALWTLALHPGEGHGAGSTKPLAVAWLDDIITLRLGPSSALGSSSGMKKPTLTSAWLGDPASLEVAQASSFKGKKKDATWLPGAASAAAWKTYLESPGS